MIRHKNILVTLAIIFAACIVYFVITGIVLFSCPREAPCCVGIIDDNLSYDLGKGIIIRQHAKNGSASGESHGEDIISFLRHAGYAGDILYYSAENDDGIIDNNGVLKGLQWLSNHGAERIAVCLSTSRYDVRIEEWIRNNPDIKIYSSYNNIVQSQNDYPSMYEGTYASGCDSNIGYKQTDRHYFSSRILTIGCGVQYYHGNTYLALISLLSERGEQ